MIAIKILFPEVFTLPSRSLSWWKVIGKKRTGVFYEKVITIRLSFFNLWKSVVHFSSIGFGSMHISRHGLSELFVSKPDRPFFAIALLFCLVFSPPLTLLSVITELWWVFLIEMRAFNTHRISPHHYFVSSLFLYWITDCTSVYFCLVHFPEWPLLQPNASLPSMLSRAGQLDYCCDFSASKKTCGFFAFMVAKCVWNFR